MTVVYIFYERTSEYLIFVASLKFKTVECIIKEYTDPLWPLVSSLTADCYQTSSDALYLYESFYLVVLIFSFFYFQVVPWSTNIIQQMSIDRQMMFPCILTQK